MFQKIYIHNYRCFQNFEFDTSSSKTFLLLGKNGTGKSTLLNTFTIIRDLARGENQLDTLFKIEDFNDINSPIVFNIDTSISDNVYNYKISVEFNKSYSRVKIYDERLTINNEDIFSRKSTGEIEFGNSSFIIDWHASALPLLISRDESISEYLNIFKNWLSSMILIAPIPSLVTSYSDEEELILSKDASNFSSWFRYLYTSEPNLYIDIYDNLKKIFEDFDRMELKSFNNTTKYLEVIFRRNQKELSLKPHQLSDGEKILIIAATIISLTSRDKPLFCFWDEPDNYISISFVSALISFLKGRFEKQEKQQLFITSHDELVINSFPLSKIRYLYRNGHLEPTRVKSFESGDDVVQEIKFGEI